MCVFFFFNFKKILFWVIVTHPGNFLLASTQKFIDTLFFRKLNDFFPANKAPNWVDNLRLGREMMFLAMLHIILPSTRAAASSPYLHRMCRLLWYPNQCMSASAITNYSRTARGVIGSLHKAKEGEP